MNSENRTLLNSKKTHNMSYRFKTVAGITKVEKGNDWDIITNHPEGLNGYILHLTTSGCGKVFDGEQYFYSEKGQILLFSPKAIHHYCRADENSHWHYQWIYFYPNSKWTNWLAWTNTIQHIGRIKITDDNRLNELSCLFSKIESELQSNSELKQEMAMSLLKYLLIKCKSSEQQNTPLLIDVRILKICQTISQDLSQNHSVQQLAELVYLSPSRLSHLFSQQMEMSLLQWRDKQRITEAKKQLYFSNISISSLAKALGYDDPLYFSKIFKKYTGLSPSQFRSFEQKIK